nr:class I SAM-dependent methyltransferase [Micromonospora sp. DSM 115978]
MSTTATPTSTHRADLARSVRLFRAFRKEQTDPAHFYGMLAEDTVGQLRSYTDLDGAVVVDVGGGAGYFADALRGAGARIVCVDCDAGEMSARDGSMPAGGVLGSALGLPIRTGSVDLCFSSNVLEHVPEPFTMADEMVRVTRSGGTIYLSYTNWLSPWGGHETSPWHYLGGHRAAERYRRRHGHPPKNVYGESMFGVSVAETLRWVRRQETAEVVEIMPRYLPRWAWPIVRIPAAREVLTWNLVVVLRKR